MRIHEQCQRTIPALRYDRKSLCTGSSSSKGGYYSRYWGQVVLVQLTGCMACRRCTEHTRQVSTTTGAVLPLVQTSESGEVCRFSAAIDCWQVWFWLRGVPGTAACHVCQSSRVAQEQQHGHGMSLNRERTACRLAWRCSSCYCGTGLAVWHLPLCQHPRLKPSFEGLRFPSKVPSKSRKGVHRSFKFCPGASRQRGRRRGARAGMHNLDASAGASTVCDAVVAGLAPPAPARAPPAATAAAAQRPQAPLQQLPGSCLVGVDQPPPLGSEP